MTYPSNWPRLSIFMGAALGSVIAISLADHGAISQCPEATDATVIVDAPADEANTLCHDNQRRRAAHERALRQLEVDRRWEDPEQRRWLQEAVDQTDAEIARLGAETCSGSALARA